MSEVIDHDVQNVFFKSLFSDRKSQESCNNCVKFITLAHVVCVGIGDNMDDTDGEQYDCYCS